MCKIFLISEEINFGHCHFDRTKFDENGLKHFKLQNFLEEIGSECNDDVC
jgi:hypothetical protein